MQTSHPRRNKLTESLSFRHKKRAVIFTALCGGKRGIRTPGPVKINGFQDRRIRPLCHLSRRKGTTFFRFCKIFLKKLNFLAIFSTFVSWKCNIITHPSKNRFFLVEKNHSSDEQCKKSASERFGEQSSYPRGGAKRKQHSQRVKSEAMRLFLC